MKAMILAAGLGTRLRPLTDDRPKALVEVAGRTMLEITLARLRAVGIREVIVNVHHFADMIVEYLKANDNFGMRIEVSREDDPARHGWRVEKGRAFFLADSRRGRAVACAQRGCHQHHRSPAHGAASCGESGAGDTGGAVAKELALSVVRRAGATVR